MNENAMVKKTRKIRGDKQYRSLGTSYYEAHFRYSLNADLSVHHDGTSKWEFRVHDHEAKSGFAWSGTLQDLVARLVLIPEIMDRIKNVD